MPEKIVEPDSYPDADMTVFERLKSEVDALAALLASPHPGLHMWVAMTADRIAAIRSLTEPKSN